MASYPRVVTRWMNEGIEFLPLLERGLTLAVIATVFFLPTSEALKNIFYVVSLVLYVTVICVRRERMVVPPLGWLFVAFLGVAIISAAVSPYPGKAIEGVWRVFVYTSFFFIVTRGVREERQMRAVLWATVMGLGVTALVTVFRFFALGVTNISALSLGGNSYTALYSVMGLVLILGIYIHTDVVGLPLFWLVTAGSLSVMLLGITHARMLWGGFILVCLILGWLRSSRVGLLVVAISVLLVIGIGLVNRNVRSQILSLQNTEIYKTLGEKGTRVKLWRKAITMWRDAPWLGVGPKTFDLHDDVAQNPQRDKYWVRRGNAHNLWLQTAVEMGSLGVVVLVTTFAYLGVWLMRCRKYFPSGWPAAVWDGAFGSWLAIMIGGITEPSFISENAMLFSMLLALVQITLRGGGKDDVAAKGQVR